MQAFEPDYNNIVQAAKNAEPERIPLYDHNIDRPFLSKVTGLDMDSLFESDNTNDLREFFRLFCGFFKDHGYDTVSFEICIGPHMPGSGSLGGL